MSQYININFLHERDIMQLFSEDTKTFLKKLNFFCPWKHEKPPLKVALNWPNFFQHCQLAQNQPKSYLLFHENTSLCDFYIMTLIFWWKFTKKSTNISFSSLNTQFYESRIFCLFTFWVFFPDKSFKWIPKYTQKCQYNSLY